MINMPAQSVVVHAERTQAQQAQINRMHLAAAAAPTVAPTLTAHAAEPAAPHGLAAAGQPSAPQHAHGRGPSADATASKSSSDKAAAAAAVEAQAMMMVEPITERGLSVGELLVQLRHYSPTVRKDAAFGLKELVLQYPYAMVNRASQLSAITERSVELISDVEGPVRRAVLGFLQALVARIDEEKMRPFFPLFMVHTCSAMTHIRDDIRLDSLLFLDLLLERYPRMIVAHSRDILPNFIELLSARGDTKPAGGAVSAKPGSTAAALAVAAASASATSTAAKLAATAGRTLLSNPAGALATTQSRASILLRLKVFLDACLKEPSETATSTTSTSSTSVSEEQTRQSSDDGDTAGSDSLPVFLDPATPLNQIWMQHSAGSRSWSNNGRAALTIHSASVYKFGAAMSFERMTATSLLQAMSTVGHNPDAASATQRSVGGKAVTSSSLIAPNTSIGDFSNPEHCLGFLSTVLPLLLEVWIECAPADIDTHAQATLSCMSVILSIVRQLCRHTTSLLRADDVGGEEASTSRRFVSSTTTARARSLPAEQLTEFRKHFMTYFPFGAGGDQRDPKRAALLRTMNISTCDIMSCFLEGVNPEDAVHHLASEASSEAPPQAQAPTNKQANSNSKKQQQNKSKKLYVSASGASSVGPSSTSMEDLLPRLPSQQQTQRTGGSNRSLTTAPWISDIVTFVSNVLSQEHHSGHRVSSDTASNELTNQHTTALFHTATALLHRVEPKLQVLLVTSAAEFHKHASRLSAASKISLRFLARVIFHYGAQAASGVPEEILETISTVVAGLPKLLWMLADDNPTFTGIILDLLLKMARHAPANVVREDAPPNQSPLASGSWLAPLQAALVPFMGVQAKDVWHFGPFLLLPPFIQRRFVELWAHLPPQTSSSFYDAVGACLVSPALNSNTATYLLETLYSSHAREFRRVSERAADATAHHHHLSASSEELQEEIKALAELTSCSLGVLFTSAVGYRRREWVALQQALPFKPTPAGLCTALMPVTGRAVTIVSPPLQQKWKDVATTPRFVRVFGRLGTDANVYTDQAKRYWHFRQHLLDSCSGVVHALPASQVVALASTVARAMDSTGALVDESGQPANARCLPSDAVFGLVSMWTALAPRVTTLGMLEHAILDSATFARVGQLGLIAIASALQEHQALHIAAGLRAVSSAVSAAVRVNSAVLISALELAQLSVESSGTAADALLRAVLELLQNAANRAAFIHARPMLDRLLQTCQASASVSQTLTASLSTEASLLQ
ncbi:hypothetical protein CAOG_07050 [Capsaspora owczarzaki ATCC 30864]|uniref:Pre-rRNA-processing protein Ipi1 N-terminal domain-containing protein n=1 Tax=Capsaspora owczarzaki (strain ATCC 30864) TaxID=595528 RepID=A0A0D2WVB9_CAPO3|nr:hypothetical protein CAOG_07050 [Capsaspora owczarzaki ATCC 30864]KJE96780.1 hypothetical protein CAOG_007050 [Capsaspora owczarzaki ATCC 30864]|eukprot:XP_004343774.1 hypothetical protein CAOG_07050 [Capsaspora owczarzaki ATCC 30864]